jgi:L-arabinonolactonase
VAPIPRTFTRLPTCSLRVNISALSEHRCHLGEGPLWDPLEEALYWVDSLAPMLYRHEFASASTRSWALPGHTIGSLAVRASGGLILAMDQGLYLFDPENGDIESIAQPLAGKGGLRLNDGKVDPFGYFVTGTMNIDFRQNLTGSMYRLSPDFELTEILDGFSCFNGPCFSATGDRLYVTGRDESAIEVFDYGCNELPNNGRVLLANCNPDGATVDTEGYLWSAQWDEACIIRISPDGNIDRRIAVPGQVVSSVTFGGPKLDLIYVTTTGGEVQGAVPGAAQSGRVLVISGTGYHGRAEPFFIG